MLLCPRSPPARQPWLSTVLTAGWPPGTGLHLSSQDYTHALTQTPQPFPKSHLTCLVFLLHRDARELTCTVNACPETPAPSPTEPISIPGIQTRTSQAVHVHELLADPCRTSCEGFGHGRTTTLRIRLQKRRTSQLATARKYFTGQLKMHGIQLNETTLPKDIQAGTDARFGPRQERGRPAAPPRAAARYRATGFPLGDPVTWNSSGL